MRDFDLNREELLSFLGVVIAFGIRSSPALEDHFSRCPLLGSPYIVRNMPYRRFRNILSMLLWPVAWRSDCGELDGDAWDAGLTRILQEVYSCLLDA